MGKAIGPMPQIVFVLAVERVDQGFAAQGRAVRRSEPDDADGCNESGACAPRSLDRAASSPSSDRAEARHAHRALWDGLLVRPWLLAPGTPRANELLEIHGHAVSSMGKRGAKNNSPASPPVSRP